MPFVRTFAPVVAGIGQMSYRRFVSYNVFGGIGWVLSMVLFGYFLPSAINPPMQWLFNRPDFLVQDHVEKVVILVVLVSISPGVFAWLRTKLASKAPVERELAEAAK